ncbi:MAG: PD-(D/E)XK nuclease family protein [Desulfamplus sp.]
MNGFEIHGIDHLSPTQLNLFRSDPALWFVKYILGEKGSLGAAALIGTAVESHITKVMLGDSSLDTSAAVDMFEASLMANEIDPEEDIGKLSSKVISMTQNAFNELSTYGKPSCCQKYVETSFDGLGVPIYGYVDFCFDDLNLDVDLKTTSRMPSVMSDDHELQAAIYAKSQKRDQVFCYITPSKTQKIKLEKENYEKAIRYAERTARAMKKLLEVSHDPEEISALLVPDFSNFKWDSRCKERAEEYFYGAETC